jgi:hypothetical protein
MSRRILTVLLSTLAAVAVAVPAAAGDGGPTPGFAGGAGIATYDGRTHYVAVGAGDQTVVEAINAHGTVLQSNWLPGYFGIPLVANDGSAGGLTRDGKRLVLASNAVAGVSQFAVLKTRTLSVARRIDLAGLWSFDALSPDGRTLYLIQYFLKPRSQRYLVRAYDLTRGRLYKRAISDRIERGLMTGWPVTRVTSADGARAYTLYLKGNGSAFVHVLDTIHRKAVCVDLPWRDVRAWVYDARLRISRDGTKLYLRQLGINGRRAVIDTRSWKMKLSSPV